METKPLQERIYQKSGPSAEMARAFASMFAGRVDAWGTLAGACVKEAVTLRQYHRHLSGETSLGIYPLLDDATCYWTAADLDQWSAASWHSGPDDAIPSTRLIDSLEHFGMGEGLYLEKTKKKGWRVWCFFNAPVSAAASRRIFKAALHLSVLPASIELFPKQDNLKGIVFGNYVNLPYFGGGPSGDRPGRVIVGPQTLCPVALEKFLGSVRRFPSEAVPDVLNSLPPLAEVTGRSVAPDRLPSLLKQPVDVGQRRPLLVKLAGYLRHREVSEEIAVALLVPWAGKTFSEPLHEQEVEKHVRGIYGRYGVHDSAERHQVLDQVPDAIKKDIEDLWK